jgi:hypothetical protein
MTLTASTAAVHPLIRLGYRLAAELQLHTTPIRGLRHPPEGIHSPSDGSQTSVKTTVLTAPGSVDTLMCTTSVGAGQPAAFWVSVNSRDAGATRAYTV